MTNSAFSASEARYLREPDEPVTCHRHGFTYLPDDEFELTDRQAKAWHDAVAEIQRYVDTSTVPTDINHHEWSVHWHEESRPGRGCRFDAIWCDGEYLANVLMDVYGFPFVSVAEVTWLHNSDDEECDCEHCTKERDTEETPDE